MSKKLTEKQNLVYEHFKNGGACRPHDIAIKLGHKESAYVYPQITALVKKGLLEKCRRHNSKYVYYRITDKVPLK